MAIKSQKSQKMMVVAISILLSFFLWLYVMGEENPVQNKIMSNVTVNLINIDAIDKFDLVESPNQKYAMDVVVTGRAFDISKLTANDIKIEADLAGVSKQGTNKVAVKFTVAQKGTTAYAKNGQTYINVRLDKRVEKSVPVVVNVRGNVKEGYSYLKPISRPTEVSVTGPSDYVGAVTVAVGEINVGGNFANVSGSISLTPQDKNGIPVSNVHIVPKFIDTTVSIKPSKEVPIKVATYGVADPQKVIRSIKPQIDRVVLVGEQKDLDKIKEIKTTALDLSKLQKTVTISLPIILPDGVTIIDSLDGINTDIIVENRIEKIIEIKPFVIKKSSDYTYNISEELISLILSGPESVINTLNEKSVEAYIDVSDYQEGTYDIPLIVNPITDVEVGNISPAKIVVDIIKK